MTSRAASAPVQGAFVLKGRHVLMIIVGFFAVVIGVDSAFVWLAVRSHPGQVSVTPYEDGLLYNHHIAQLDAQARLGWSAAAETGRDTVILTYRDREGGPVRELKVAGRLERPATEAGHHSLTFSEVAPGRYEARVAVVGAWDLTAEARDAQGRAFVAERRLTWP